jgi:hypothetical protein
LPIQRPLFGGALASTSLRAEECARLDLPYLALSTFSSMSIKQKRNLNQYQLSQPYFHSNRNYLKHISILVIAIPIQATTKKNLKKKKALYNTNQQCIMQLQSLKKIPQN